MRKENKEGKEGETREEDGKEKREIVVFIKRVQWLSRKKKQRRETQESRY